MFRGTHNKLCSLLTNYQFLIDGFDLHSLEALEIKDMLDHGVITRKTLAYKSGMGSYQAISSITELTDLWPVGYKPSISKCFHCDNLISERAKSCPECGNERGMKCGVCEKIIPANSKSCPKCGDPNPFDEQLKLQKDTHRERILCPDGVCIGIINEKGVCNRCGKPYIPQPIVKTQETANQTVIEKQKVVSTPSSERIKDASEHPTSNSVKSNPVNIVSFFKAPLMYLFLLIGFTVGGKTGEAMGDGDVSIWMPLGAAIGAGLGYGISVGIDGMFPGKGFRIVVKCIVGIAGWLLYAMALNSMGLL